MRRFLRSGKPPIELDEFRSSYRRTRRITAIAIFPSLFVLAGRIEHAGVAITVIGALAAASLLHTQIRRDAPLLEMSIIDTCLYVALSLPLDVPEAVMMMVIAESYILFLFVPARTALIATAAYSAAGLAAAAFSISMEYQVRDTGETMLLMGLITALALGPATWALLQAGAQMHARREHEEYLQAERERLSSEREQVVVELQEALDNLSHAQAELLNAQKLEAIGSLAAGIAHEINTPIQYVGDNTRFAADSVDALFAVARAAGDLVERLPDAAHESDAIAPYHEATQAADIEFLVEELPAAMTESLDGLAQVARIVQALKSFAHPGTPDRSPEDLNELITSTVTVSRNEWKYVADAELSGLDADLPQVPVMSGPLKQVILNLLVNAAHAIEPAYESSGEKGTISVRSFADDSTATIEIQDTGSGIPEDIRDRILEPFFTTKDVGKGTGQGLAIASSIVGKHDGTLSFETECGVGTTFRIELPLEVAREESSVPEPVGV